MSVTAEDVAAYLLRALGPTHTFKLQKLLYYVQAWTVAATDRPLLAQELRAFKNGPVVYDFWKAHEGTISFVPQDVQGRAEAIPAQLEPLLDAVIEHYGRLTPTQLIDLTHEERPWQDAWECKTSDRISVEALRDFYVSQLLSDDVKTPHIPAVSGGVTWVKHEVLESLDEEDVDAAAAEWAASVARTRAALSAC